MAAFTVVRRSQRVVAGVGPTDVDPEIVTYRPGAFRRWLHRRVRLYLIGLLKRR